MEQEIKTSTINFIKHHLKIMNLAILLSIAVVFLLVVKFVTESLAYLPKSSIVVFLSSTALLSAAIFILSRLTNRKAMDVIVSYDAKLRALLSTSRDVHGIGYSDMVMEKIMDTAIGLTGADGGSLFLESGENVEFKIVRGANAEKLQGKTIPKGTGIVGWVIREGAPVNIPDAKHDERHFGTVDDNTGYQTRSILCVPFISEGKAVGALELVKSVPGHFTRDDEEMLQYFVAQAAISMHNSQYHEDSRVLETHLTNILVGAVENIYEKSGHMKKVARYALAMGRRLELKESEMRLLYTAAILHDIGFLKIDLRRVRSVEEYHAHAFLGYELLRPIPFYREIAPIVLHHHERYDGSGYPEGLTGSAIPLLSRVISIAEVFDVITNKCSFKNAGKLMSRGMPPEVVGFRQAMAEIQANAGTQFDPKLVEVFIKAVSEEDMFEGGQNEYFERMNPAAVLNRWQA